MFPNGPQLQNNAGQCAEKNNPLQDLETASSEKGFKVSANQGTGNCMFYALAEQLEIVKGIKIQHGELRQSLVQYLRENPKQVSWYSIYRGSVTIFQIILCILVNCEIQASN